MSKTLKVTYGVSIMMGEHWQKISVDQLPDKGETMETILDEVSERLKAWHKKKYPDMYKKEILPVLTPANLDELSSDNEEWEEIKNKLSVIIFQEDAQEFINTTNYAMTIEAKKIINSKPLKNEKK